MKKIKITSLAIMISLGPVVFGQDNTTLTLQECVQKGIERNIRVETAQLDQEKSAYKISETRSSLLPQVSGSGSFQNNIQLPVTMLPGDFMGQPGTFLPLKMGIRYNTSVGVSVNQLLYNQTAITGLKLAKKGEELSSMNIEKAREELAQELSKLYFLAQTTARQKDIIQENINRINKLAAISKVVVDNGMGRNVDNDRIQVNLQNLFTQLDNTDALHQQQLNMIKYMLDMPIDSKIELTDTVSMPLLSATPSNMTDFSGRVDIRMLTMQQDMAIMNQKLVRSEYLPSLAAMGQWSYMGMRDQFGDYFKSGPMSGWYSSTYIGLSLKVPIFNGLDKRSRSQQARIDYQKSTLTLDNTQQYYQVNYNNAMNNYFNNRTNVERQQQNMDLAEKVYTETALKYREGMANLSDLLQDETSLSSAQSGYLNALYNLKEAELDIMMLNGEISQLISRNN